MLSNKLYIYDKFILLYINWYSLLVKVVFMDIVVVEFFWYKINLVIRVFEREGGYKFCL